MSGKYNLDFRSFLESVRLRKRQMALLQRKGIRTYRPQAEEHVCLNCGAHYVGFFCPLCGQETETHRFTMRNMFTNVYSCFFSIDGGFLRTVSELCWRPGFMIRDYLAGRRVPYFKPFKTLMVLAAIYLVVSQLLGVDSQVVWSNNKSDTVLDTEARNDSILATDVKDADEKSTRAEEDDDFIDMAVELLTKAAQRFGNNDSQVPRFLSMGVDELSNFMRDNPAAGFLVTLPFASLGFWLGFRRKHNHDNYNVAEHFFIQAYVGSQMLIIAIFSMLFSGNLRFGLGDVGPLSGWTTLIWMYDFRQLMGISWMGALWRIILSSIYTVFFMTLALVLAAIPVGLLVWFVVEGK